MKHAILKVLPVSIALCFFATAPVQAEEHNGRIILHAQTLMHEMRATPSPLDKATVDDRKISFQWPLPDVFNDPDDPLDGMPATKFPDKSMLRYRIRYSRDPQMKQGVVDKETIWPMYNPDEDLQQGQWYWQYGYVGETGVKWSKILTVTIGNNGHKFCPPAFSTLVKGLPASHPRIWVTRDSWDAFISQSKSKPEYQWYVQKAEAVLKVPMKKVTDINTSQVSKLKNDVQKKAYLTRESRRIIDAEEGNCNALIGAYLLTKDDRYAKEALNRTLTMVNWDKNPNVKGDFNDATLLSLASKAYDSFWDILTQQEKDTLRDCIKAKAGKMYKLYNNHLENHIADNHVWQMTLRILTMACFATIDEIPEAKQWADYCYEVWVARMPGLNDDGAWHNGDSYFTVNTRTLIDVPWFYSRLSGFDFFSDPWYERNIDYTIFQQPPFSKSAGNGSAHLKVWRPNSIRIGYLDALARLTGNTYAADFVNRTLAVEPNYLYKAFLAKPGDLAWFRLQCNKPLPAGGKGLKDLPLGMVFPATGLASVMTDWNNYRDNAMWSFRSSPYGSTSHAIANQNAFNTFYGGRPLFYSSGHHISFIDRYTMYCHRATRAHNTILVNGMGQRIGTEGYGWIPRYYMGTDIHYVLGDASNAYGKVISPLWLERGKQADVPYTPETGWDTNHLKTYRRHMVSLGNDGLLFIYDELEADEPVTWTYLLHSVTKPLGLDEEKNDVHVWATNDQGISDAYIYSPSKLKTDVTDQWFYPLENWLRADANGKFTSYPNHWHFSGTSGKSRYYHFATFIDTRSSKAKARVPELKRNGCVKFGTWTVTFHLDADGKSAYHAEDAKTHAAIDFKGGVTTITEDEKTTVLSDKLPKLEI